MNPLTLFKCLSDDTRLKVMLLLSDRGELCVCDLQDALALSQPKISRHLAQLRECALVQDERRGKWVYYALHPALPDWVRELLTTTVNNSTDYLACCAAALTACCAPNCEKTS
ncbi:metalloregulator ArsR/SmtB family transcription factor [Aestuariibacter halophilus]|uniref:Metalloregulator ArsR/SmtB family transcription factor n=1 Tax=Fluctibacter halophilus TaxID=226011 RepID=A0ABS8G518_9ALTE|nr:metalloregulator ArsR/SmtB family transcription factor [Aestuariibacter halophilus]MCC2614754.1 metalloregulator ArsR/SmtB family transcription factor [Aestuariibacter halophilus]